jgi:mono/diheme cytochrome c family protein
MSASPLWSRAAATIGALFLLLQILPFGRPFANPPVQAEPAWDSPRTRELAQRACFDCHSNETVWPWYSYVAPLSWRVVDHVREGREALNFSTWNNPSEEAEEAAEVVQEGEMPLRDYLQLHPEARLTPTERQQLIAGLQTTLGGEGGEGGERHEGRRDRDDD